jgi:hypothetical protein
MGMRIIDLAARIATLAGLVCTVCFAESWSGALVDAKCYDSAERNKDPKDTLNSVNRDKSAEIHYCHPGAKTKFFALVQQDGLEFRLDPGGNAKAAELVRKTGKVSYLGVNITGQMGGTTIQVDSITAAP